MAIESRNKLINGRSYTVAMLPALEALDVFEELTKLAGPALAALSSSGIEGNLEPAAQALFGKLGGGQLRGLTTRLLKSATVQLPAKNGEVVDAPIVTILNVEYAGKLNELFQVLAFSVEVNFGDFYDGLRTLLARPRAPDAASPSSSPSA